MDPYDPYALPIFPQPQRQIALQPGQAPVFPQGVDWSRYNQPFGQLTDTNPVVHKTANPLTDIRQADINKAIDMGLSFSGGGLSTVNYPLFHGSPSAGLKEILPSERGALGPGAYFTPAEGLAQRYGEHVYQLPEKPRDVFNGMGNRYGTYEDWKADKARLLSAVEPEKKADLQAILDKMWANDGYPTHVRIAQMYRDEAKAQDLYKRAGFEGFSGIADGPEVVFFDKQSLK